MTSLLLAPEATESTQTKKKARAGFSATACAQIKLSRLATRAPDSLFDLRTGYDGTEWKEEALIVPQDAEPGFWFGYGGPGYALSDDGNVLAVAARNKNVGDVEQAGAVFVYRYDGGGTWNQEQIVTEDEPGRYVRLGYAVALSGEYLVAGSPDHGPGLGLGYGSTRGALWFFRHDGTSWKQESKLQAIGGIGPVRLGTSVFASNGVVAASAGFTDDAGEIFVGRLEAC